MRYNIKYKKGKRLDLYKPTKKVFEKTPVVVHFHGGGWVIGSKLAVNNARFHGAFNYLRENGYAIISPKYTLARKGKSPFPNCLADANDALAWVEKNAGKYNFDLNNIGLMGESAGAHIALMAGFCEPELFNSEHHILPKYIIDIYGPSDLYALYRGLAPMLNNIATRTERWPNFLRNKFNVKESLFGFNPSEDETRAKAFAIQYSPVEKIKKGAPNILIIHGTHDQLVPVSQSYILKKKLDELHVPNEMHVVENAGHAFRGANHQQWENIQKWIVEFVLRNRHL